MQYEPLATHRGITHGLFGGVLVLPVILWGLLLALDRWQVARGIRFKSGLAMHPLWLLALCVIGALTHPLLDLQTTYSVQLLSPFSGRWYHSDSLFIIDAWIWLLLIMAIASSQAMEAAKRPHWRRPAQAALAIGFGYICFNLGLSQSAAASVRALDPGASAIFASPPPLAFWRRDMSWRNGDSVRRAHWRLPGVLGPEAPAVPDNMRDPLIRLAIARDPNMRDFLNWSVLPVAKIVRSRCSATVFIADGRYGLPGEGEARLYHETRLDLCG